MENEKKLRKKTNLEICKENDIKYSFLTNVVEETSSLNKIRATMQIIAKTLSGTLGPYGSTTLIQDRTGNHIITKDGYDLCNRINFQDETARTVLDVVKNIASNQVLSVGDGSTSAIIVANSLLNALTKKENREKFSRITSKDITSILNTIRDFLEIEIKKYAKKISPDMKELETIAKIATNNDEETGKFIFDLYRKIGKYGFITTEVKKKIPKDEYDIKDGITWERGAINECFFIDSPGEKKIEYKEPVVFVSNSSFTYNDLETIFVPLVGEICGSHKSQLIIIGEDFSEDVIAFFRHNREKHKAIGSKTPALDFTVVDIDTITKSGRYTIEDIALLCGCDVFDKFKFSGEYFNENKERFLGSCEKAIIEEKKTQIIGSIFPSIEKKEKRDSVLKEIEEKLEEISNEETDFEKENEIFLLKKRLSHLKACTAVINVGGKTLTERVSRERLIEDAIFACKSALKFGYITGGNIMVPRILFHKRRELLDILESKYFYIGSERRAILNDFVEVIQNAFLESYKNVLNNSYLNDEEIDNIIKECLNWKFYNLKTHKMETDDETEVINSLDTDLQILNSTISIIGILGVSNQVITLNFSVTDQVN